MRIKNMRHAHQGRSHHIQTKRLHRLAGQQVSHRRSWWYAPPIGYAFSLLFVVGAFLITKIGIIAHIHDYFVGVPFVIGTFLAGWIWGIGPALLALVMGVLSLDYWIIPPVHILTLYKWPDTAAFVPFIGLQLIVLYLIQVQKKYRQQLRLAQQEASKQAEELAQSNQALARSNTQLEQADRVKDQFLSMASHELRTPVTSIHGYVQLLMRRVKKQSSAMPELLPVYNSLVTVDQQAKRLTHLMNELLDINSLRAGKIPLHCTACDLGGLCQKVVAEQTATSGRPIDLQLPPDPLTLSIDPERLSQVINNLVINAIKYAPKQAVIRVEARQQSQEAILAVHNDGSILSPEQQVAIFEPFYRSPEAQASATPGWGLGLAISKEIVVQHQGRLWVESSEEAGTTFFVALDLNDAEV